MYSILCSVFSVCIMCAVYAYCTMWKVCTLYRVCCACTACTVRIVCGAQSALLTSGRGGGQWRTTQNYSTYTVITGLHSTELGTLYSLYTVHCYSLGFRVNSWQLTVYSVESNSSSAQVILLWGLNIPNFSDPRTIQLLSSGTGSSHTMQ